MLIQLYSETDLLLKPVVFKAGINIILGKYSTVEKKKGINGIGKSSLIRLVNFLLLSNSAEQTFLQAKYDFLRKDGHNVILEFRQNNVNYFIKRTFGKGDAVYFGTSTNYFEEYTKTDLKKILTNKFFPFQDNEVFFEGERYGTLMDFFIKDDLQNAQRVEPLSFSARTRSQIDIAVFNFFLYGLPTRDLLAFGELSKEQKEFSDTIKGIEKNIKIDNGKSIEEFRSERIKVEKNIQLLESSLDDYKFLENYKKMEGDLVDITIKINEHLQEYYMLSGKITKVKESYKHNKTVDTQEIEKLYNEASHMLGELVSKKLDEIISFKTEILENRNKFLIKKETELQKSIDGVLQKISMLEQTRSSLYKKLEEKGALDSITNAYEQLTVERTQLAGNKKILEEIDSLQDKIGSLQVSVSEVKNNLLVILREHDDDIKKLRALFIEILQNAIVFENGNPDGYFDISVKSSSTNNQLPFKIVVEIPKADALGQSRLKIVAYDMMVFLHNINQQRAMPHFIIHDGVFHAISLDTKIKALNYIYHQCLQNPNFQYITTFNEDEIAISEDKKELIGEFRFQLKDVLIAQYTDNPEEMIFKRNF